MKPKTCTSSFAWTRIKLPLQMLTAKNPNCLESSESNFRVNIYCKLEYWFYQLSFRSLHPIPVWSLQALCHTPLPCRSVSTQWQQRKKDLRVDGYKIYIEAIFRRNRIPFKLSSHAQIILRCHVPLWPVWPVSTSLKWLNHYGFKKFTHIISFSLVKFS